LLIAGETMQQHHGRMQPSTPSEIEERIHALAMTRYQHLRRVRRV
jgi:hypothetical protein